MITNDTDWLSLTDSFHAAAFDPSGWYGALDGLARATGSTSGELIGLGADAAVPFNLITNVDPDLTRAFVDLKGGDPRVNPRVNAGINAPVLKVLAESDFITPEAYKRHPHYQEFAVPWDIPYICLTTLEREAGMVVGLAVCRSARQGHITSDERQTFAMLAPHVRAAVRTQIALEGKGAALLAGAMEALSMPAFVCDRSGQVRALTPAAEEMARGNRGVRLRMGHLYADNPNEERQLQNAISAASQSSKAGEGPRADSVLIRARKTGVPSLVLDVVALPAHHFEFTFAPRVLIVARTDASQDSRRTTLLKAAYALTAAETEVALQIANGKSPETIATAREVSVGTVRIQLKSIFAKMGVKRQSELVAKINQL